MAISELIAFNGGLSTKTSSHLIGRNEGIICQNVNLEKGTLKSIAAFEFLKNINGRHLYNFEDKLVWNNANTDDRFYDEYGGRLYWTDEAYNTGLRRFKLHTPSDYSTWSVATVYTTGDIVQYTISSVNYAFYAMQNSTGQTPVLTDTTYWALADNVGVSAVAPDALNATQKSNIAFIEDTTTDGRLTTTADYSYAFTSVDADGIESAPVIKASGVTFTTGSTIKIYIAKTNWSTNFTGVETINVYRTGGDNPTFNLIAEGLNATTMSDDGTNYYYLDTIADIDVSRIELTTFENTPPPDNLDMLIELKGTMWGAWDDKIYFSQSGSPEFWGELDYIALDKTCTGLGKFGDSIIAFTRTSAYKIDGYNRDNISIARLPFNQGCTNKHSVSNIDAYLIWASMNGICIFDGSSVHVVTKKILAWDEFGRLGNKTYDDYIGSTDKWETGYGFDIQYAIGYQDRYYGVYNNGIVVLDMADGIKVSTIYAENVVSVQYDYDDNFLYIIIDALDGTYDVYMSTEEGSPTSAVWKTGRITDGTVNKRKHYRRVELDGTPQSVTIYIDGVQKYYVEGKSSFFLPPNLIGRDIQFEISTINEIRGMKYEYSEFKA